jgi:hypothetical protein
VVSYVREHRFSIRYDLTRQTSCSTQCCSAILLFQLSPETRVHDTGKYLTPNLSISPVPTTGEVVPIKHAFSALTSDIVSEYCFGGSENYIEAPGFNSMVNEVMDTLVDLTHITVQAQWVPKLINGLPERLVESLMGPGMAKFNDMKRVSYSYVNTCFMIAGPNIALR